MTAATVIIHRSPELLAAAAAARLVTTLVDVQSAGRVPRLVLTGGRIADRIHRTLAESAARDSVDWGRLEIWWGDERFLPADDPDRNERQARSALLDLVPIDPGLVHPMPAPGDVGGDPETAAERYAAALAAAAGPEDHGRVPTFDVLMLGVGPDGHVASLFPEQPALYDEARTVTAVRGAPKPPPTRITMTMPTLSRAHEVWFCVSGREKARAVHLALGAAGAVQVPAAGPRGMRRTLWLLDREAAAGVPPGMTRVASP
ncbi:MAG TPA: 6-phosphogluconolactonase [Nocardioidaceae bacterium]|nr:6-phosphogluconolactonase [Nocardioidaceae bacterium]